MNDIVATILVIVLIVFLWQMYQMKQKRIAYQKSISLCKTCKQSQQPGFVSGVVRQLPVCGQNIGGVDLTTGTLDSNGNCVFPNGTSYTIPKTFIAPTNTNPNGTPVTPSNISQTIDCSQSCSGVSSLDQKNIDSQILAGI